MVNDPQDGAPRVKMPTNMAGKKIINLKCRNPRCASITAVEIVIPGTENGGQRLYQCTECGRPLPVNVGGAVNL